MTQHQQYDRAALPERKQEPAPAASPKAPKETAFSFRPLALKVRTAIKAGKKSLT